MLPSKIYKGLKYALLDIDEYTLLKKFFATFFKNDKTGMQKFLQQGEPQVKILADVVFRCKRLRFE